MTDGYVLKMIYRIKIVSQIIKLESCFWVETNDWRMKKAGHKAPSDADQLLQIPWQGLRHLGPLTSPTDPWPRLSLSRLLQSHWYCNTLFILQPFVSTAPDSILILMIRTLWLLLNLIHKHKRKKLWKVPRKVVHTVMVYLLKVILLSMKHYVVVLQFYF